MDKPYLKIFFTAIFLCPQYTHTWVKCVFVFAHVYTFLDTTCTWMGSCCLNTGVRSGRIRRTYSSLVHSSAMSSTLGNTNGTMSGFTNSELRAGRIRYTITLCKRGKTTLTTDRTHINTQSWLKLNGWHMHKYMQCMGVNTLITAPCVLKQGWQINLSVTYMCEKRKSRDWSELCIFRSAKSDGPLGLVYSYR